MVRLDEMLGSTACSGQQARSSADNAAVALEAAFGAKPTRAWLKSRGLFGQDHASEQTALAAYLKKPSYFRLKRVSRPPRSVRC